MAKIAFLLRNQELIPWIKDESKAFPFEEMIGANKPADAYVVLAEGEKEVEEFRSVVEGHMFAWFGDGADQVADLRPFSVEGNWEAFDADSLVTIANEMHMQIEAAKQKEKETEKPARPSSRPRLSRKHEEIIEQLDAATTSFGYDAATDEPQVIAVGGHGGTSFVAWNLAAITRLPLIEGRRTGSLAEWTGDQTPVERALEETLPYGTVTDEIPPKSIVDKRVIVDCGSDPRHPVFENARIRIWVTTLDPAQPPIPERVKVVLNRVPDHLPFEPREVVKADIALQVPDGGLDVLISLFTHIPWIAKQGPEAQEQWKALIRSQNETQKGDADAWANTGW